MQMKIRVLLRFLPPPTPPTPQNNKNNVNITTTTITKKMNKENNRNKKLNIFLKKNHCLRKLQILFLFTRNFMKIFRLIYDPLYYTLPQTYLNRIVTLTRKIAFCVKRVTGLLVMETTKTKKNFTSLMVVTKARNVTSLNKFEIS